MTLWNVVCQAPLSMGFSRQEYWNGLPFPPPGDLADPGIKTGSPALQADSYQLSYEGRVNHVSGYENETRKMNHNGYDSTPNEIKRHEGDPRILFQLTDLSNAILTQLTGKNKENVNIHYTKTSIFRPC